MNDAMRHIYNLCKEVPPTDKIPLNFRWQLYAHSYEKIRDAYRGISSNFAPDSIAAGAAQAGREAR